MPIRHIFSRPGKDAASTSKLVNGTAEKSGATHPGSSLPA
jgi:hypothetical protein